MAWGFIGDDDIVLTPAERDIYSRIGDRQIDVFATGVLSNVYRVASLLRNHMEREVLGECNLSFTAFIVMFTLWVWGDMESNRLASRAGVTKGTLTGVVKTLEKRGLCVRQGHSQDRRRVIVALSDEGRKTVEAVAPSYNYEESRLVEGIGKEEQLEVANALRMILMRGMSLKEPSDPEIVEQGDINEVE